MFCFYTSLIYSLGADITDYFNYGFNEETWTKYCERQRRLRSENAAPGTLPVNIKANTVRIMFFNSIPSFPPLHPAYVWNGLIIFQFGSTPIRSVDKIIVTPSSAGMSVPSHSVALFCALLTVSLFFTEMDRKLMQPFSMRKTSGTIDVIGSSRSDSRRNDFQEVLSEL